MSVPSGTFTGYSAIGNREDLTNIITLLTPYDTPFFSMIGRTKASGTLHEWQTQALAAAASNVVIEGDDASNDSVTPTVRVGNYVQLLDKVFQVSTTQQWVDKAGRTNELAEQGELKALELKRDIEYALLQNGAKSGGSAGVSGRKMASIEAWIATNVSKEAGGVNPTGDGTDTRTTSGTLRALAESQVQDVLQACYSSGGKPDTLMAAPFNRRNISSMTGNATNFRKVEDKKLVTTVTLWESDWGDLKIIPNRHQIASSVYALQTDSWRMAVGKPFDQEPLAKTGHSDRRMLSYEATLEALAQQHNGIVADLTTS